MAKWGAMKNHKIYDEQELVMGSMVLHKPGNDLIQNCDLPPPMKIFSMNKNETYEGDAKLGLLRALRLSQTRAREAEAKCLAMAKEKETLVNALVEDSMQIFGYRQLVNLLDFHVYKKKVNCKCYDNDDDGRGNSGLTWNMALAICFGVAGFGFAIGYKYFYF